jgi:muconolactone delta-isomerase
MLNALVFLRAVEFSPASPLLSRYHMLRILWMGPGKYTDRDVFGMPSFEKKVFVLISLETYNYSDNSGVFFCLRCFNFWKSYFQEISI